MNLHKYSKNCQIENLNDMKKVDTDSEEYKTLTNKNRNNRILQRNQTTKSVVKDAILPYIENNNIQFENNPLCLCFNNRVFDLLTCQFIEPNKDDHMTITTGYDYRPPTKEETKTLNKYLVKVFPKEDERLFYLTVLATGFHGKTLEKFMLANGSGRNGKGFINELMLQTIGNYGYTCANGVLLAPLKTGSNQEVANMDLRRFLVYREPRSD